MIVLIFWVRLTRSLSAERYAQRIRASLERMGTLWIRAGQMLALRSDLLSPRFCAELAKLRDQAPAVPFPAARRILEEELGGPLERIFDELEEIPIAATTISQIHSAHLRHENVRVAVRVQHPYARATFATDARLIRLMVRLLKFFSIQPNMRWDELRQELDQIMIRELDYRYEAASVRELRKKLRRHGVYLHKVFSRYSTPRVLVTEFVTGALMSDVIRLRQSDPQRLARWLAENDIDPRRLARRLFDSVFRQVFEDDFFHADLHPENIILLRSSRFSVLDCRNVGELEAESLVRHRMFFEALAEGEYSTAADVYFLLATSLPVVDTAEVKARLVRAWRVWEARSFVREMPYGEKSIGYAFDRINGITFEYGFASRWSLSRLARTWANLDASLEYLHPEMNCLEAMRRYFRRAVRRRARTTLREAPRRGLRGLIAAGDLPKRIAELRHFRDAIFRRQAQVFQGSSSKAGHMVAAAFGSVAFLLLLGGALAGAAFLDQHYGVSAPSLAGDQIASLVRRFPRIGHWPWIAVLLVLVYFHRAARLLKKRFSEPEVRVPEAPASV